MKTLLQQTVLSHKRLGALLAVAFVCVFALWLYARSASQQFAQSYNSYASSAESQQNAAFVPGAAANPLRDQLNQMLTQALVKETSVKDRLALSNEGLLLVDQLNKQVDAIGDSAPAVAGAILQMQSAAKSPGNILNREAMLGLADEAQKEMATIEDIRGLSYRANFETAQIFKRIISDKGELTAAYTIDLNNQIPVVEDEFNKRENSYSDLQSEIYGIQQAFAKIGGNS